MEDFDKEMARNLETFDAMLTFRESRESGLQKINSEILKLSGMMRVFPRRWYVRNPSQNVITYLERKHGRPVKFHHDCGYGEMHGEIAFVPRDVDYSWRITQMEFDLILKNTGESGK